MMDIVQKLEPRMEQPGVILYKTVDEVDEIFFISTWCVDIGFEISRVSKYVVRLSGGGVVGAFGATFNQKTLFIYKVAK